MNTLRNYFGYLAYCCYLKLPWRLKTVIKRVIKENRSFSDRYFQIEDSNHSEIINFISQIASFIDKGNSVFYVQPTIMNFLGTEFYPHIDNHKATLAFS